MSKPFCEIPDLASLWHELLAQVPAGRVTTCGAMARALGSEKAALWVGHFAVHHDHHPGCPCHRLVRAGGKLGAYIGGTEAAKARLLADEGVEAPGNLVDLDRYGCDRLDCGRPLEKLRRVQQDILKKVLLRRRTRIPKLVGGVDVSYQSPNEGTAAYALVETSTGRLVWSTAVRRRIVFPYISTYLTFRELPILLELLEEVELSGRLSEVVLVDGTGILHPRRVGVATHLGVVASMPTIGVTKKLLCGQVDVEGMLPAESRPVLHGDRPAGVALRATSDSRRPIFISPGHRVDLAYAERLVRLLMCGRRLPEPLYWADRISREVGGRRSV